MTWPVGSALTAAGGQLCKLCPRTGSDSCNPRESQGACSRLGVRRVVCACSVVQSAETTGYSWDIEATEINSSSVPAPYVIPKQPYQIRERSIGLLRTSVKQRKFCIRCAFAASALAETPRRPELDLPPLVCVVDRSLTVDTELSLMLSERSRPAPLQRHPRRLSTAYTAAGTARGRASATKRHSV